MARGPGRAACAVAVFLPMAATAQAMPGAVPWDHYGGPGRPDCTACHFDAEAIAQSPALRLEGLPERAVSGNTYELALSLKADGLLTAGFLIGAEAHASQGRDASAGDFLSADNRTQAGEGALRSTAEGARPAARGVTEWRFSWHAPENFVGTVTMHIAGVAANDDLSPLGDRVHLLHKTVAVGTE